MAEPNTSLVNAPNNKPAFSTFMTSKAVQNRIGAMVSGDGGPRFISSVVSAVSVNPMLAECDYGTILSAAMMLRYSLEMPEEAAAIEEAVNKTLESGLRTGDIMEEGMTRVGCKAMGEAIVKMIG